MALLKSRDITLPTKIRIVKAMFLPVVMYRCESWTLRKAEHRSTDAFQTENESPLDSKESKPVYPKGNQPWIFIRRTDAEAEAPVLWPPDTKSHWKRPWWWEREGGNRGWHGWVTSPIQSTWVWANSRRQWRTEKPGVLQSMGSQRVGYDLATDQQPPPHELMASQRPLLLIPSLWGLDFNVRIRGDTFIYYPHSYANPILSC